MCHYNAFQRLVCQLACSLEIVDINILLNVHL